MNRILATTLVTLLFSSLNVEAATRRRRHAPSPSSSSRAKKTKVVRTVRPAKPVVILKATTPAKKGPVIAAPFIRGGPWTEPTYADSTTGDFIDGEDLTIRRAAVEALGPYNGSVVVVDPNTGRILAMVNQKQALGAGFQPCSTIKVPVALAGLNEGVIAPTNKFRVPGMRMDLTYALAHSNNFYFATLGNRLGFEKVSYYAHLFGLGVGG